MAANTAIVIAEAGKNHDDGLAVSAIWDQLLNTIVTQKAKRPARVSNSSATLTPTANTAPLVAATAAEPPGSKIENNTTSVVPSRPVIPYASHALRNRSRQTSTMSSTITGTKRLSC